MMKRRIEYFLAFMLMLIPVHGFAQEQLQVKVMSMNIRLGGELAGYKTKPYADIINAEQPDFVALQEVYVKALKNQLKDWLNELAEDTGMFPIFFKSMDFSTGGSYGTAILSRYPFYRSTRIVSEIQGEREPRASGWVYVMFPDGQQLRFATVHLALQNATNTTRNIADINKHIFAEDDVIPTLLVGDFNAEPDSDPINYAKIKWQEIAPGSGFTIPAEKPAKQLDFMMGYPKKWKAASYRILPHKELSDHCFIVAELSLKK